MFKKLNQQIESLKQRKHYFESDWATVGHKALMDFYVKIIPKVVDAERCSIFIHDPGNQEVWYRSGTGQFEREIQLTTDSSSVARDVIDNGKAIILENTENMEGEGLDTGTGIPARNVLCVPIRSLDGKEITGAVQVLNKADNKSFTEDDQMLVEEMAHYLESSLENFFFNEQAIDTVQSLMALLIRIVSSAFVLGILLSSFLAIYTVMAIAMTW